MSVTKKTGSTGSPRRIAVIGGGIAGIACARTLQQAGCAVTVFERTAKVGGRMATLETPFGGFDQGAQYFTVRDPRFEQALATAPGVVKSWSANSVRVLDPAGRKLAAVALGREPHWVGLPGMDALVKHWAEPLMQAGSLELQTHVLRIAHNAAGARRWQLHTEDADGAAQVRGGFDAVLTATPAAVTRALFVASGQRPAFGADAPLERVQSAACWTLNLAFPHAAQPNLTTLGPHWNAARSTHHRIAWLSRESSKPGRSSIERWTVQASAEWSDEHDSDDPQRAQDKLLKAFSEVTGIRAAPSFTAVRFWREAKTMEPAGHTHLFDATSRLGACGDWCIGARVEDAFVSGLSLALAVL